MNIENIDKFKYAQEVAFDCAIYTQQHLEEGMSEIDACEIMVNYLKNRDVKDFFHLPFAWFGDRTAFKDFERPLSVKNNLPHFGQEFLPTNKELTNGMCVILDVAPIVDGVMVDIGHSFSFGENTQVKVAQTDLIKFRNLILDGVKKKKIMSQIYFECDLLLKELNYQSGHALYPLGVLGHRVGQFKVNLPKLSIRRFQLSAYSYLLKNKLNGMIHKDQSSGIWNQDSDMITPIGLWAIEPHLTTKDFGVKFEEILVVTENDAFWLSDDLPHIKVA